MTRSFVAFCLLASLALGFALLGGSAFGQEKGKSPIKWEYKVVSPPRLEGGAIPRGSTPRIDAEKLAKTLNELGEQGWECVATINDVRGGSNFTDVLMIFKRVKK